MSMPKQSVIRSFIYLVVAFSTIFSFGCGRSGESVSLKLKNCNSDFSRVFQPTDTVIFRAVYPDTDKVIDVFKVVRMPSGEYLVLDVVSSAIYRTAEDGRIIKKILSRGRGPGQLMAVADFTIGLKGHLYAIDPLMNKVAEFDSAGNFIRFYQLPYSMRAPVTINWTGKSFVVSDYNNLESGSAPKNYKFLEHKDVTFLSLFDTNFVLQSTFLHPLRQLWETGDALFLPEGVFVPVTLSKNMIIAATQEGFYWLDVFNYSGNLIRKYHIKSPMFSELSEAAIGELKRQSGLPPMQKLGQIRASYSSPSRIMSTGDLFVVKVVDPYDNYYPQYSEVLVKTFHYDIFRLYPDGSVSPVCGGLKSDLDVVGASSDRNEFYFTKSYMPAKLSELNNKIFIMKVNDTADIANN